MLLRLILYYLAGFLQGLCLVIVPAASAIFKQAAQNDISDVQYGLLALPMISAAILATATFAKWTRLLGRRKLYYLALLLNAVYLATVAATHYTIGASQASFILLMIANFCLGAGFGFLVSLLNILVVEPFKRRGDTILTGLHGFLGIGAAFAPQLVKFFQQENFWQGASLAALALLIVILFVSLLSGLAASKSKEEQSDESLDSIAVTESIKGERATETAGYSSSLFSLSSLRKKFGSSLPGAAWIFLAIIFLYGIVEAVIGYWTIDYLSIDRGLEIGQAASALSIFWLLMTVGRISASLITLFLDGWYLYLISPPAIFCAIILLISADLSAVLYVYIILGSACSYFFPLSISLNVRHFPAFREQLSGFSVAALMAGIGVGNFVLGLLKNASVVSLEQGFQGSSLLALLFAAGALFLFIRLGRGQAEVKKSANAQPS